MNLKTAGRYVVVLGAAFSLLTFVLAIWGIWVSDPETAKNIADTAWCFGVPGVIMLGVGGLMLVD